jgi:hypothetical protein
VYWDSGAAHLLPRLLRLPDGSIRTHGPLLASLSKQQINFTTDRAEVITELCDGAEATIAAVAEVMIWMRSNHPVWHD